MSRIDDLIEKYAPDGVVYKALGDVVDVVPTPRGIKRERYRDGSRIAIVDQGQS